MSFSVKKIYKLLSILLILLFLVSLSACSPKEGTVVALFIDPASSQNYSSLFVLQNGKIVRDEDANIKTGFNSMFCLTQDFQDALKNQEGLLGQKDLSYNTGREELVLLSQHVETTMNTVVKFHDGEISSKSLPSDLLYLNWLRMSEDQLCLLAYPKKDRQYMTVYVTVLNINTLEHQTKKVQFKIIDYVSDATAFECWEDCVDPNTSFNIEPSSIFCVDNNVYFAAQVFFGGECYSWIAGVDVNTGAPIALDMIPGFVFSVVSEDEMVYMLADTEDTKDGMIAYELDSKLNVISTTNFQKELEGTRILLRGTYYNGSIIFPVNVPQKIEEYNLFEYDIDANSLKQLNGTVKGYITTLKTYRYEDGMYYDNVW